MEQEIEEALFAAAGIDMKYMDDRVTPSQREIAKARRTVARFLEDLDGGLTVSEIRDAMERSNEQG